MVAFVKKPSGWLLVRHFSQELLVVTYVLEKGDFKLPTVTPSSKARYLVLTYIFYCYPGYMIVIEWMFPKSDFWVPGIG